MRKYQAKGGQNDIKILTLDDDLSIALTIQSYFRSSGFAVDVENDPLKAIERIRETHYDILLLDFLMTPICGDKVVEAIRAFNNELYIVLLTGHKSMAPPLATIRALNIQGYFEKSDRFDQLELLIESCAKSIGQLRTIRKYRDELEDTNLRLTQTNDQLQAQNEDMIKVMRSVVDARDIYTCGHSDRVAILAQKLSIAMGREEADHIRVRTTGLFHDIGKIKVPDRILLKEGRLNDEERLVMQAHPQNAVDIVTNAGMFKEMIPGILQHHERFDGGGYPLGLCGSAICEDARIICVADCFDAMTSFRRYRADNMTVSQAQAEISRCKGTQFDPEIADAFIELLNDFESLKADPAWSDPLNGLQDNLHQC